MQKRNLIRKFGAVCAFWALTLPAAMSHGAVTATPASVTFNSMQQIATIALTSNGVPLAASAIRSWQFLASGNTYEYMLRLEKQDGSIQIALTDLVELGSYDLTIDTASGPVNVQVFIPLNELPDIVEKTAALTGMSEKKIEARLGLSHPTGRTVSAIDLPTVYYEGQTLKLSMPEKAAGGHMWFINGELVSETNAVSYTFVEPGEYVLTYLDTAQQDGKLVAVGSTRAYTRVVGMPGVPTVVSVDAEVSFLPPPGYTTHVWRIDGQEVSTGSVLKHTFVLPGNYTVECLAASPAEGPADGFRRVRYNTTVNSK